MSFSKASRTYLPGDVIHKEEPFAHILPRVKRNEFCESCYRRCFNLRSCKECLAVKYCDKACQKKDWKVHRVECKSMKNLQEEKTDDMVRLLGRIIHKIKDKEWKDIKIAVLGTEVSFDDIDPHYKDITENPYLNLCYQELKERTRTFIGPGNTPSDIDMLKIIGKVMYNSFVSSVQDEPVACFFFGMFMFEHQCVPNSSFMVIKSNLKVWANRKIVKGSEKISVCFRNLYGSSSLVYNEIVSKTCNCSDCSLPYGESLLSKILDQCKAFSVITLTKHMLKVGSVLATFHLQSDLKRVVDALLERHNGVLGRTNILHLKLLAFRSFQIGGPAFEILSFLKELESTISSMLGECSIEMIQIYKFLVITYFHLGQLRRAEEYISKAQKLVGHFPIPCGADMDQLNNIFVDIFRCQN